MQLATFENGGFVIHRATVESSPCRFSAWFTTGGDLIDAERIDRRNRGFRVAPASPAWETLARLGRVYAPSVARKSCKAGA